MSERFKATVPPGDVAADDNDRDDCASDELHVIPMRAVTNSGRLSRTSLGFIHFVSQQYNSTITHITVCKSYVAIVN